MNKMTARDTLDKLYEAFERHLAVAQECDNVLDERVLAAEEALQNAFFMYDQVLFSETGMELPFDIVDDDIDVDAIEFVEDSEDDDYDDYDDDEDDLEDLQDSGPLHRFDEDEYEVYDYDDLDSDYEDADDSEEEDSDDDSEEEEENPT